MGDDAGFGSGVFGGGDLGCHVEAMGCGFEDGKVEFDGLRLLGFFTGPLTVRRWMYLFRSGETYPLENVFCMFNLSIFISLELASFENLHWYCPIFNMIFNGT